MNNGPNRRKNASSGCLDAPDGRQDEWLGGSKAGKAEGSVPQVRSERPGLDFHHPEVSPGMHGAARSHSTAARGTGDADTGSAPPSGMPAYECAPDARQAGGP